jgi:lipopolysaccharide biosynthesis glycosyltransferase
MPSALHPYMDATSVVHIAIAGDDAYALPMAVTVRSAIEMLAPGRRLHIHVLDCGISDLSRERIRKSWQSRHVEIEWHGMDMSVLRSLPAAKLSHISASTYARLFLETTLPARLERVLFLDSDLLVLHDVGELWSVDMRGALAMGAPDVGAPWLDSDVVLSGRPEASRHLVLSRPVPDYQALGLAPDLPYVNVGVLLIDLAGWRRCSVSESALACLADPRRQVVWDDQYALNVTLAGKLHPLHAAWNQGSHIYNYPDWISSPFDSKTFEEIRSRPKIVHFTTGYKPWLLYYRGVHRRRWFEIVDLTDWASWRPGSLAARFFALQSQRWNAMESALLGIARNILPKRLFIGESGRAE